VFSIQQLFFKILVGRYILLLYF